MIRVNLMHGDCLEKMKEIPDKSVDLVLTDPPYGTTACKWDSVIPFKEMWQELKRILRNEKSAVLLFGTEPFSSGLRMSNIDEFKYDWTWIKDRATNHLNCKKQPMRTNELISVFYKKQCKYFPQITDKEPWNIRPEVSKRPQVEHYGKMDKMSKRSIPLNKKYPSENLRFKRFDDKSQSSRLHPTQKPIALLEYLIKTYTLEGETVLDFTMGSGSTGVACKNTNRNFIGIEREDKYYEIAKARIEGA